MAVISDHHARPSAGIDWLYAVACAAAFGLVIFALWPALSGIPFWDDLYSVMAVDAAAARGRPPFAVTGDLMAFWRPIELTLIALLRPLEPEGFVWVKLASLCLHAAKAVAIALLVRRIAPSLPRAVSIFAGLIALVHPIAVSAIVQIDTISEAIAAAAIAWAFLFVLDAVAAEGRERLLRLCAAAALGAVALFGKESALPAAAALPLAGLIAATDRRKAFAILFGFGLVLAMAAVVFIGLRYALGFSLPATNDGRYNVGFGANVAKNLATIAGSLSFFGNTASLIGQRNPVAAIGFTPVLIAAGLVVVAVLRGRLAFLGPVNARIVWAAIVMALAATAAPALAPMISEHNAALSSAGALPAGLAIIAAAAVYLGPRGMQIAALAGGLAVVLGVVSMTEKSAAAAATGARAGAVRTGIASLLEHQDRVMVCVTPTGGKGYSIYRLEAERWVAEEVLLARAAHPGKMIDARLSDASAACDLTVPNLPDQP